MVNDSTHACGDCFSATAKSAVDTDRNGVTVGQRTGFALIIFSSQQTAFCQDASIICGYGSPEPEGSMPEISAAPADRWRKETQ